MDGIVTMQRIIVSNAKGGSGKSTIATNLASHLARNKKVSLFDYDPQGSSMHWLRLRDKERSLIHSVAAHRKSMNAVATEAFQLRVPANTDHVICDTPAAMNKQDLAQLVQNADVILIPVCPSPIDIHVATRFIGDLLIIGKARAHNVSIGVIANRVRTNTIMYKKLVQFLKSLSIPFVAAFRDTQHYHRAAEVGAGVNELPGFSRFRDDTQWEALVRWLDDAPVAPELLARASAQMLSYRDAAEGKALWKRLRS